MSFLNMQRFFSHNLTSIINVFKERENEWRKERGDKQTKPQQDEKEDEKKKVSKFVIILINR